MCAASKMLLIASFLGATGCASYQTAGPPRAALPLPDEIRQYYQYSQTELSATISATEAFPSYSIKHVNLSGLGSSQPIQIIWYAPIASEPRPLILISPIRGSDTLIVDGCAKVFANQGFHAAIVKRLRFNFDPNGSLSQVEDSLRTAVVRHRQALDWLLAQPGVEPKHVATFGISYGAMVNAVLAAVEPRIKVHVIDLAGGPIAAVMKSSAEHSLRRDWRRSRRSHDLTNRELYAALREIVRTDPVKLAPYVERDTVLMLIARFDRSVPTRYQLKLWEALGKPQADFVLLGHYTSILALPAHRDRMMRFLEENLRPPARVAVTSTTQSEN